MSKILYDSPEEAVTIKALDDGNIFFGILGSATQFNAKQAVLISRLMYNHAFPRTNEYWVGDPSVE